MTNRIRIVSISILLLLAGACVGNEEPVDMDSPQAIADEATHDEAAEHGHATEEAQSGTGAMPSAGDMHDEAAEHSHDDGASMVAMHNVPAEAAAVINPVLAGEDSLASGADLFAANCAICHGETGAGDGPGAAELDPKPADLRADHVQMNSDGALFYIISHGVEGTAMPPWDPQLGEEERWHVVNYVRALAQERP